MSRETALVTTDWVIENLKNPHVVFVEVDEDTTLYEQGHIEGAITFHWRDDLQDGLVRDLVSKEKFEALLSKNGIANDTTVVLYGGNNNWFATYAYWYFKIYGHQDVRLIDGGRKLWELKALPLVKEVPARAATRYVAKERDNSIRAFRDEVIAAIGTLNIVDVRSPAEFPANLQPLLTFHKKADKLRDIFQLLRTFLGQRQRTKMELLNQRQNLNLFMKALALILQKTQSRTAASVSVLHSHGLYCMSCSALTM